MVSRLPISARPAADEIAVSYLARLATLHDMPFDELWKQASRPRRAHGSTLALDGDRLAHIAGQPRERLNRALIELRGRGTDWLARRHQPQRGCRRCNARHPGGLVWQLLPHHRYVCTRHRIWIGPDQFDHPQPDLDELPEVVAAQHRHLRLLRRVGPAATYDAVLTGFLICAYRWNFVEIALDRAWLDWHHRAEILIPSGTETATFSASRLFAATYPEAVSLAELIGSLHWRRRAAGDPDDQRAFAADIGRRLGLRDYRPVMSQDPIAHWIEQDCWQPPSLPNNDYRSLKTFGGRTFRKPDPRSEDTRLTSAHWFAAHRRGGDAMLHHHSLNPVLIRDWSRKMELFAGALDVCASVSFEARRSVNGAELHTTEYVRPTPVTSLFLDTAVEPVPWPQRTEPRPPTGARPWLPHEKPKPFYGRGPLRSST